MATDTHIPRLLRVRDVERLTGLEGWRLYELIAAGEGPPHLRIGRVYRFPEDMLAKWIEERATTSSASRSSPRAAS